MPGKTSVIRVFYIKTLIDEFGIDLNDNAYGTYDAQHDTPGEAVQKHREAVETEFKIKLCLTCLRSKGYTVSKVFHVLSTVFF